MSLVVAFIASALGVSAGEATAHFVDRASEAGLSVVTYCGGPEKNHILESTGTGVVVIDYDLDGFADVYFVNAHRFDESGEREPHSGVLYRNRRDGTFEDTTERAGVETAAFGQGGAVGDVDADGLPDLYVTAFGNNHLFRNNGDGTFEDWTARAGVAAPGWSLGASFLDADADGHQDLFVAGYIEATWEDVRSARRTRKWRGKVEVLDGPRGLPGAPNVFYRNRGDGTFAEATSTAGLDSGSRHYSMGAIPIDYDLDGDVDLYVANDSTPNALYRNDGAGSFEEIGAESGAAFSADGKTQGSMGVDAGDVNGDGFPEIVVTNFAHDYYALYRNVQGTLFLDDSFAYGVALASFAPLGWGTLFLDADLDADLDLFFANGQIYPQVDDDPSLGERYGQRNQLLLFDGERFADASADAGPGLAVALSSRGAASADLDRDGDLEILVSNEDASPTLLVNESAPGHWLSLYLTSASGDRTAVGARVVVESAGVRQSRFVVSGGSYASQSEAALHFGLGASERVDALTVLWPGGGKQRHEDLRGDRRYLVKAGVEPIALPTPP